MDACLDLIVAELRSTLGLYSRVLWRRYPDDPWGYPVVEYPAHLQRVLREEHLRVGMHVYTVSGAAMRAFWNWLHPPAEPDWDDLASLDDIGDPIRFPDPLDTFLRQELTEDRDWALIYMPECERLEDNIECSGADALARLHRSFTGENRGFAAKSFIRS